MTTATKRQEPEGPKYLNDADKEALARAFFIMGLDAKFAANVIENTSKVRVVDVATWRCRFR